ncbi:cardiolipin synthase [bacterium BMS3Bbin14]|nr:cardiolipin synthase [bacterium BMS3Abin13]GBE53061.1 cardiolipin synthase [bacterium BMS3Bbin14]HDL98359.1 cardiolipin synthase [Desulfobacteraceae bacterium]HDO30375.1 cardiolipin synthase [Desulfobacteraceae bacterium]HDZ76018.1 cardiolipin synthase [Desulfobacteraceae bacterium]
MNNFYWIFTSSIFLADLAIRMGLALRVIMRKRAASVTLAWLVVILFLPLVGAIIYLLFGENRLGEKRAERVASDLHIFTRWAKHLKQRPAIDWNQLNPECRPIHRQANTVIGLPAMGGNKLTLIEKTGDFLRSLVIDIDQARSTCFLEFYIWNEGGLADEVAEALIRAARRGITCRILLDSIGSKLFLRGERAAGMRAKGIEIVEALPAGIIRAFFVRIDLRNHRKIVVIDGRIAYTGSQNLVDPRFFKQNENVGRWIDTMVRVEGPVVEAMTATFLSDWTIESHASVHDLIDLADIHPVEKIGEAPVQLVPSGPGFAEEAIHNLLLTTIYAARRELILTTPYFVPDNAILAALKSAADRGVEVTIIVPEKNDSKLVHYASNALYERLAMAGVRIMLFTEGLLHAKTITVDNDFSLIGSVNLDMRSFWLNFELTLFVYNKEFTAELRKIQQEYLQGTYQLDTERLKQRSFFDRFKENSALVVGPLL